MSPVNDPSDTTNQQHDPGSNPWRLGLLSLLAVLLVGGGFLLLGGDDTSDTPTATTVPEAGASITIPPMPAAVRGEGAAPDFSLELFDGTVFSLAGHLADDGRPLILNLWASWCPPCRDEMPDFEAAALANPGVLILGVAVDDRRIVQAPPGDRSVVPQGHAPAVPGHDVDKSGLNGWNIQLIAEVFAPGHQ